VARRSSPDPNITNQPDLERVAGLAHELTSILFQQDPRVRAVYLRRRELGLRQSRPPTIQEIKAAMVEDYRRLKVVVRDIGLDLSSTWLPKYLVYEFSSAFTGEEWHITVPKLTGWAERGRAPKGGWKSDEDLARNVSWFYRSKLKDPPDSIRTLAAEYVRARAREKAEHGEGDDDLDDGRDARPIVRDGIRRVQHLLAYLNASPPLVE
jgi:hypothetical protein